MALEYTTVSNRQPEEPRTPEPGDRATRWYGPGGKLVGETDGSDINNQWIYFDGRRIATFHMTPAGPWGAGILVDANGSLRVDTDAFSNPKCHADYYPFGEPVGSACTIYAAFQFAGLYTDPYDANYSAALRRYNYTYYRWFSPDPGGRKVVKLDDPQTWNMYAYVGNNPITLNDPGGLQSQGSKVATVCGDQSADVCTDSERKALHESSLEALPLKQTLHYKKGVPPASGALRRMLGCTQDCAGSQLTITSTTDRVRDKNGKVVAHSTDTPHGRGEAADIRANRRNASNILVCGAGCGAEFGLNEVVHPSKDATGPHVHLQITPGRHGGRRDLPPALVPSHLVLGPEPPHPVSDHSY